jgi:hypothetical protein
VLFRTLTAERSIGSGSQIDIDRIDVAHHIPVRAEGRHHLLLRGVTRFGSALAANNAGKRLQWVAKNCWPATRSPAARTADAQTGSVAIALSEFIRTARAFERRSVLFLMVSPFGPTWSTPVGRAPRRGGVDPKSRKPNNKSDRPYKLHLGERSNDLKRLPTASCRQCQTSALSFGGYLPALCFNSLLLGRRGGDATGMILALAFCQC